MKKYSDTEKRSIIDRYIINGESPSSIFSDTESAWTATSAINVFLHQSLRAGGRKNCVRSQRKALL